MTLPEKRIQESHKQEEKSHIDVRFPAGEAQNPAMEVAPQSPGAGGERSIPKINRRRKEMK